MKYRLFFAVLVAALPVYLIAAGCSNPQCYCDPCYCDPCHCGVSDTSCGSFEVFGDALYIQPSTCGFSYVIEDCTFFSRSDEQDQQKNSFFPSPVGKEHSVCPDYEWGFRVGVGYVMNDSCLDARLYYSRLCTSDHRRMCPANDDCVLWPTYGPSELLSFQGQVLFNGLGEFGINAFADNRVRIEWNAVDGEVAARQMRGCNLSIRGHVGLEWAEICVRRDTHYQGTTLPSEFEIITVNYFGDIHSCSRSWGVGPRVGIDVRYDIACGFGVGAHGGAGILAGEICHCKRANVLLQSIVEINEPTITDSPGEQDVCQRTQCRVFPEFDAAIGLNYLWCCGNCFSFLFEVGYEWRTYLNSVQNTYYLDQSAEGNNATVCDHFAFSGLYLRGLITF